MLYSPIYDGGLTNHLPMMLKSMERLGLSAKRINEVKRLYLKNKNIEIAAETDTGQSFLRLREEMKEVDVREYLSDKLHTFPSALFHCLIRLYFSIGNREDELSALAYYEMGRSEYNVDFKETKDIKLHMKSLIEMRQELQIDYVGFSSMEKYRTILSGPLKEAFRTPVNPNPVEMLDIFLDAFSRTKDFYILHIITGFQALLGLKEYLDIDLALVEYYKHAQVFIVLNNNFGKGLPKANHNFDYYLTRANTLEDAHDIKLLYSLMKLREIDDNEKLTTIAKFITKG